MRPLRPESTTRAVGRVGRRATSLERRNAGGGTTTPDGWTLFEEPFDNGFEYTGVPYVFPAWKPNPNAGKHPFLRGSVSGGVSGTSPFTLPPEAGAPFDGTAVYAAALTDGSNLTIDTIDEDGVVTVFLFDGASAGDIDTLTDALAAHLADTSGAHAAGSISVIDADGNYTASDVEGVLAEIADMIAASTTGLVPTSRTITAGAALTGGGDLSANRTLDVAVDGTTIEVSGDALRVKDGGITSAKIADGTITTTDLAFDPATQTELDNHVNDTNDAHDASAISFAPGGTISATDVQSAIEEVAAEAGTGGGGSSKKTRIYARDMVASTTGGASGPNHTELTTNKQNIITMDFADGSDLKAEWVMALPEDYAGESFTFTVYALAAGTATDSFVFGLEARAVGDDEDIDGAWGAQSIVSRAHTATANRQLIAGPSAASVPSNTAAAGDLVYFRLQRLASSTSPLDGLGQTVKVLAVEVDFTGDGAAAMPSYIASGTPATSVAASPGDISVPYSASIAAGDFLLAHIVSRSGAGTLDTVPAGWTLLPTSPAQPDAQSSTIQQWLYYKFATGSETGSETWSVNNASLFMGWQHTFRGVDATMIESGGKSGAISNTISHTNVVTSGPNRLALLLGCISNDVAVATMSGETGGDWTEPTGEYTTATGNDGALFMMIAEMPAAGTLTGGTITLASALDAWLTRSFALLPIGA